jgi:HSP20 family protein
MSTLTLWSRRDPFAEFDAVVRRAFGPTVRPVTRTNGFVPAADLDRDGDDAVVRLELPGLDAAKDVTVEVDGGRLVVKGERRSERTEEKAGRTLREVRYGSFERSFGLPEHITADAVSASYDAGVLTVRVAGVYTTPESSAKRIAVTTGSTTPQVEAPAEDGAQEPTK